MEGKLYAAPLFELVRQDDANKVFFTASGGPTTTTVTAGLSSIVFNSTTSW